MCGPLVDGSAAPAGRVPGNVRSLVATPKLRDEGLGVVALLAASATRTAGVSPSGEHANRRVALDRAARLG